MPLSPLPTPPRNRLLAALPPADLARLLPRLVPVEFPQREIIHPPGDPMTSVYFPETGWLSVLALLEDGDSAEVGLIGPEGMSGLPLLFGTDRSDFEMMVQGPGHALRLDAATFRAMLDDSPQFRDLMLRYAMYYHTMVARTAGCNGRHQTEQRLARWLLMAHDRAVSDDFAMTHEFLSMMLGVRRAGVTVSAGTLQRAGLITYERGRITVTDREGLENAACECYGALRREQTRLLAPVLHNTRAANS